MPSLRKFVPLCLFIALVSASAQAAPVVCEPQSKDPALDGFLLRAFQMDANTAGGVTLSGLTAGVGLVDLFRQLQRPFTLPTADTGTRVQVRKPLPLGDTRFSHFNRIFGATPDQGIGLTLTIDVNNSSRNASLVARWRSTDDETFTESYTCR
jgi:hypothetical protein